MELCKNLQFLFIYIYLESCIAKANHRFYKYKINYCKDDEKYTSKVLILDSIKSQETNNGNRFPLLLLFLMQFSFHQT